MNYWQEALLILGMLAVTFGVRYPILALSGRIVMPHWLVKALSYVPVAVLSAIAVPMMLAPQGNMQLRPGGRCCQYRICGFNTAFIVDHRAGNGVISGAAFFPVIPVVCQCLRISM